MTPPTTTLSGGTSDARVSRKHPDQVQKLEDVDHGERRSGALSGSGPRSWASASRPEQARDGLSPKRVRSPHHRARYAGGDPRAPCLVRASRAFTTAPWRSARCPGSSRFATFSATGRAHRLRRSSAGPGAIREVEFEDPDGFHIELYASMDRIELDGPEPPRRTMARTRRSRRPRPIRYRVSRIASARVRRLGRRPATSAHLALAAQARGRPRGIRRSRGRPLNATARVATVGGAHHQTCWCRAASRRAQIESFLTGHVRVPRP